MSTIAILATTAIIMVILALLVGGTHGLTMSDWIPKYPPWLSVDCCRHCRLFDPDLATSFAGSRA